MDTNEHELLLKNEVFRGVGCAMELLNTLGPGVVENSDKNALLVEWWA